MIERAIDCIVQEKKKGEKEITMNVRKPCDRERPDVQNRNSLLCEHTPILVEHQTLEN